MIDEEIRTDVISSQSTGGRRVISTKQMSQILSLLKRLRRNERQRTIEIRHLDFESHIIQKVQLDLIRVILYIVGRNVVGSSQERLLTEPQQLIMSRRRWRRRRLRWDRNRVWVIVSQRRGRTKLIVVETRWRSDAILSGCILRFQAPVVEATVLEIDGVIIDDLDVVRLDWLWLVMLWGGRVVNDAADSEFRLEVDRLEDWFVNLRE